MRARKDDAASREVRCKVKSGAAHRRWRAPHALTASYVYYLDIFEADPDTSAAWTSSGVNAVQIGPEVVNCLTSPSPPRLLWCWAGDRAR